MRRALPIVFTLLACGQPNENPAAERVRLALLRMPTCLSASDVGALNVTWACTEVQCSDDACNTCFLREVTIDGAPVELQRARDVLDLDGEVNERDASAIRDVVRNVRMSFSDATCLSRK